MFNPLGSIHLDLIDSAQDINCKVYTNKLDILNADRINECNIGKKKITKTYERSGSSDSVPL